MGRFPECRFSYGDSIAAKPLPPVGHIVALHVVQRLDALVLQLERTSKAELKLQSTQLRLTVRYCTLLHVLRHKNRFSSAPCSPVQYCTTLESTFFCSVSLLRPDCSHRSMQGTTRNKPEQRPAQMRAGRDGAQRASRVEGC